MEEFRRKRLDQLVIFIQTKFRTYINRKRFLQMKQSQIIISRAWRTWRVSPNDIYLLLIAPIDNIYVYVFLFSRILFIYFISESLSLKIFTFNNYTQYTCINA